MYVSSVKMSIMISTTSVKMSLLSDKNAYKLVIRWIQLMIIINSD